MSYPHQSTQDQLRDLTELMHAKARSLAGTEVKSRSMRVNVGPNGRNSVTFQSVPKGNRTITVVPVGSPASVFSFEVLYIPASKSTPTFQGSYARTAPATQGLTRVGANIGDAKPGFPSMIVRILNRENFRGTFEVSWQ